MNSKQALEQKVCQRYGWSFHYHKNKEGYWACDIQTELNSVHHFVSDEKTSDSKDGQKKGIAAVSHLALEGLNEEIKKQEEKPIKELTEVFPKPIDIYESTQDNWNYFWNHKPDVVGVDTEGNNISPPVLVQIATASYTIFEVPRRNGLSQNVNRLLKDNSIIKVFCDNFAHKDKKSLGLVELPEDLTTGPIIDLEDVASKYYGPVKVARGLSRVVTLAMPELTVRIQKSNKKGRLAKIGRFSSIEQGREPTIRSIYDLSSEERQYAALDAFCTLQTYERFREIKER